MRTKIISLLMTCLVGSSWLLANDCSPWEIERAYPTTPVVFVGRIESVGKSQIITNHSNEQFKSRKSSDPIRFKVRKVYKGRLGKKITIWTVPDWAWYGYMDFKNSRNNMKAGEYEKYPPDTDYLIFAYYDDLQFEGEPKRRVLTVSMCSRSALLSERADDVQYIEARRTKRHRAKTRASKP